MNSPDQQRPSGLLIALALSGALTALTMATQSFLRFGGAITEHQQLQRMIDSDLATYSYEVPPWLFATIIGLDALSFLSAVVWFVCAATGWALDRSTVPTTYVVFGAILLLVIPRAVAWIRMDTFWLPHTFMPLGVVT